MFDFLNSGEEAPQQSTVGGFLNPDMDPVSQAFLLNAGLRMLAGGWGHPATKVAGALSSGLEAAGGAAQIEDQMRRADVKSGQTQQELDQRLQMHREDIGSREKIAKMYADQRLESSKLRGGSRTGKEDIAYRAYADKYIERMQYDPNYQGKMDQLEEDAAAFAERMLERQRAATGAGKTSPNSPGAAPPVGPPGAQSAPGNTSPNMRTNRDDPTIPPPPARKRDYVPAPAGALGGSSSPRALPTPPRASKGKTPMSVILNDPNVSAEKKRTVLRNSQNAAGRKYLESSFDIDPYN